VARSRISLSPGANSRKPVHRSSRPASGCNPGSAVAPRGA